MSAVMTQKNVLKALFLPVLAIIFAFISMMSIDVLPSIYNVEITFGWALVFIPVYLAVYFVSAFSIEEMRKERSQWKFALIVIICSALISFLLFSTSQMILMFLVIVLAALVSFLGKIFSGSWRWFRYYSLFVFLIVFWRWWIIFLETW